MSLKKYSRYMRRKPTRSEKAFRERLCTARISFRCQVVIGFFIVDFVVPEKLLVIEVDGPSHEKTKGEDEQRDRFLRACGFDVIRIANGDVHAVTFDFITRRESHPDKRYSAALERAKKLRRERLRLRKPVVMQPGFDASPRLVR